MDSQACSEFKRANTTGEFNGMYEEDRRRQRNAVFALLDIDLVAMKGRRNAEDALRPRIEAHR